MKQVDNKAMLEFLEKDLLRNFYNCDSIVNAGSENFGVKNIIFYTADGNPSDDYASFSENIVNELLVTILCSDESFISDVFNEIKKVKKNFKLKRIGTDNLDLFETRTFKKNFKISKKYEAEYGVYACLSKDNIPQITYPSDVRFETVKNPKGTEYSGLDDKMWDGLSSQIKFGTDSDLLFAAFERENLCGYLLANSSYKNVYDISNVFVAEKFRGKKYGTYLTVFFADFCYRNGFIPHYGTAVSKYSERVALNSGFEEVSRIHYADIKFKRKLLGSF